MWHIANYEPTTLFSLRPANATTSGGKTLITPTPYVIKMALLDAAIRVYGLPAGKRWFSLLRDLEVAVRLPAHLVVINTFIKILRPHKSGPKDTFGTGLEGPMGNTIAYRELVYFGGWMRVGLRSVSKKSETLPLAKLLPQIHYLGKRGGFMQFRDMERTAELPAAFTLLNPGEAEESKQFNVQGTLQLLDDCGKKMSFAHADIYDSKLLSVGKANGRILNPVVLPYKQTRSSKSYTLYERID